MIIKNSLLLGIGVVFSRFPLLLVDLFAAKYLDPPSYVDWILLVTFVGYGNFAQLGCLSSFHSLSPD